MFQKPTVADLRQAAKKLGMNPSDTYLNAVEQIITPLANAYATLDTTPDELPAVKYPRGQFYRPSAEENPHGAWYVKTSIKGKLGGKLTGRRIALKDNVCLAGVPMMVGTQLLEGYVPEIDATVVERILDSGGEIAGKAVCEYYCVSGGSHTSSTGPVHNPRKRGYTTGGSSSGSAALVAAGEVDMAIGGDQAGSIRIPRPSFQPNCCNPCRNAATRACPSRSSASPTSTPIRRVRSACCARAPSGHAAAPPTSIMNSRRFNPITSSVRASTLPS